MNLADIYRTDGNSGLRALAEAVGANPKYLYQCAVGLRYPSPAMAWRLVEHDARLSIEDLYRGAKTEMAEAGEARAA